MPREDQQERRLRPIYDAMDARNWKTGLKLVNAAAQKHGDSPILKALKAVALQRLGKIDEVLQLSKEICEAGTADEHVLNTLSLALRPLDRMSDITAAYEKAADKQGSSLMMKGLFNCYLRENNYTKQQHTALKLSKAFNDTNYLWWAVGSYVLQARAAAVAGSVASSASGMTLSKLLQLAEGMITRIVSKQGGTMKYEELMMYLDVLLAQGKVAEARKMVQEKGPSIAMLASERRALEAALHIANDDLEAAAKVEEEALLENPNDWGSHLLYMDCLLPGTSSLQHGSACSVPHVAGGLGALPELVCQRTAAAPMPESVELQARVERIQALIQTLIQKTQGDQASTSQASAGESDNKPDEPDSSTAEAGSNGTDGIAAESARESSNTNASGSEATLAATSNGVPAPSTVNKSAPLSPYLAAVELERRLVLQGIKDHQELAEAIFNYYLRAGHRASCSNELRSYTKLVEGSSRQWLINEVNQHTEKLKEAANPPTTVHQLNQYVNAIQIQHDLGMLESGSLDSCISHAVSIMELYSSTQSIWQGLDPREAGPADHLITLSTSALMSTHSLEPHSLINMLRSMLVLHAGVLDRPFHGGMQLGLSALYGLLGCPMAAARHFKLLDIKHIQLDSLASHHLLPVLISYHAYDEALQLLQSSQKLFDDHCKDSESLFSVFKNASWSKVLEFAAFTERLENAHSRALVQVEHAALSLLRAGVDGLEAVEAALPRVCSSLPSDMLDPSRWGRLRFNQDLATRPAWLPPALAQDCHLAVAHWWSEVQPGSFKGYARCWWASPFAVEGSSVQAKNTRAAARLVVARRGLLPLVFRHSLQLIDGATSAGGAPVPSAEEATKLFEVYSRSMGFDADAQRVDAHMKELANKMQGPGGEGSGAGSSCLLLMQTCAAFKLAVTALNLAGKDLVERISQCQRPITPPSASSDPPTSTTPPPNSSESSDSATFFCSRSTTLAKVMRRFCEQLSRSIGNAERIGLGALIPGSLISLAALYAHQQSCMLLLTCQAWSRHCQHQASKKKKGKKDASSSSVPACIIQVLKELQQELLTGCQVIADALAAVTSRQMDTDLEAMLTRLSPSGTSRSSRLLWGWQSRLDVREVLLELLREQRQTINGIHSVLQGRIKMVRDVKFEAAS